MRIIDLRINHLSTPLGFELTSPRLSWAYDGLERGDGTRAVEERITLARTREELLADKADDLLFDTGWQAGLDPRGTPLRLGLDWRRRYFWRVQVRTDSGRVITSDPTWFETGVMEDQWISEWITTGGNDPQDSRHPLFSRRITLKQPSDNIERARVYACGLGLLWLFVDGRPVDAAHGQGRLDPGNFTSDAWLQTMAYDVTDALKGEQKPGGEGRADPPFPTGGPAEGGRTHVTVSILLGNGWYRGRVLTDPAPDPAERPWDLIAEVHVWYKDGTHQVVGTNADWKVTRSFITASSIYDGESRDDTLPVTQAAPAVANEHNHPILFDRLSPPVTVCARLPVKRVLPATNGGRIFDLGQNFAGVFRLHSRLPRGAHLTILFGEHVEDGRLDRRNLRTAKQRYDYVSDGREKTIEPYFTYYGYRYAQLRATSPDGRDLTDTLCPTDFTGLALSTRMERAGRVSTGSRPVNRFLSNVEWSRRSNFVDTPTDCPQRDERLGWTGEAQAFAPTALFLSNATAFYRKYLFDMRAAQERASGMVPVIIPARGDQFSHLASAGWSDAAVILPWTLYRFTGDPTILSQCYPLMRDWVEWIARTDGGKGAWRSRFHFGDWLALDGPAGPKGVRGATPSGLIADCYWSLSARILSRTAGILHNSRDEEKYARVAHKVRERILADYFQDGLCQAGTQTGYILALALGLGEGRANATALKNLLNHDGGRLKTGFVGTSLLVEALSRANMTGTLVDLLLDPRYPGWLSSVRLGATTVWERGDSLLPDGRLRYKPDDPLGAMNSLNHVWPGCVAAWFFQGGAGFNQAKGSAGFARMRLRPHVSRRLGSLSARFHAPGGLWRLSWRIGDGTPTTGGGSTRLRVVAVVPFNASAELVLPCSGESAPRRLGPGRHVYEYTAKGRIPR